MTLFFLLVSSVLSASINIDDPASLGTAVSAAMGQLANDYYRNRNWDFDTSPAIVDWFIKGKINWCFLDHAIATKDTSLLDIPSTSLGRNSYGAAGDLLNGVNRGVEETWNGKWNDDIAWWALAMSSGVDLLGPRATMKQSVTYLEVAIRTWNQMIEPEQYDRACGGGIYWSRNRNSNRGNEKFYKSSITNTQFMLLSARLTKQTGNTTYMRYAREVYAWMKNENFVTSDFKVLDGGYAPSCTQRTNTLWSYNAGMMIAALSEMYIVTQEASFMSDMNNFINSALNTFTSNGVLYEPECYKDSRGCDGDPKEKSFIAQLSKGLAYAYKVTNDEGIKANIKAVIDRSVVAMAATCTKDWECSYYWLRSNTAPPFSTFDQYPAAELLVAAASVRNFQSSSKASDFAKPRNSNTVYSAMSVSLGMLSLIFSMAFFF